MPQRPKTICTKPGCNTLTNGGRCTEHKHTEARRYDQQRKGSDVSKLRASGRYRKFRTYFRANHPICADPFGEHLKAGRVEVTRQVHHKVSVANRMDLALVEDNCAGLCTGCHARVEAMERRGESTLHLWRR